MQKQISKLYRQTQMDSAPSGRQIEISILELASSKLRSQLPREGSSLPWSHDLDAAMKFNQKVWDVFSADWMNPESRLSSDLRQNLLSIAIFVKKKTFTSLANPTRESLELLISLNDNIVDGLKAGCSAG
jgi:flagellar protein FlaF